MSSSCPCSWCCVTLRVSDRWPDENPDSYPCGHARCFCCRRVHVDSCWVCTPPPDWTTDDAFEWAVRLYRPHVERALIDFAAEVSWIRSGAGGGGGNHSPDYQTVGPKIYISPPHGPRVAYAKAPYVFTIERVLRAAMQSATGVQGRLVFA